MSADKGHGRRLRRARNIIKKWQNQDGSWFELHNMQDPEGFELAIKQKRYERAVALLLAEKLSKAS